MRRVTLTIVALALLLSLGIGVLVGRMAGGGSRADRINVLSAMTPTPSTLSTPEATDFPARLRSTPAG